MGKMKGNRLNTAANVGSFVTGRQQLKQQRLIAGNTGQMASDTSALLAIQQKQVLEADYDRLLARMDRAVAEGRMTREEADTAIELEWYNRLNPAPKPTARVAPTKSAIFDNQLSGTSAGWYQEVSTPGTGFSGLARYWDGKMWTLQTMPYVEAKQMIRQEFLAITADGHEQKSRLTAGLLGVFLGFLGVHRFYLGNKGLGVAQVAVFLLTFWFSFGLVGVWGLVEGIMILSKSKSFERDASGVPLK